MRAEGEGVGLTLSKANISAQCFSWEFSESDVELTNQIRYPRGRYLIVCLHDAQCLRSDHHQRPYSPPAHQLRSDVKRANDTHIAVETGSSIVTPLNYLQSEGILQGLRSRGRLAAGLRLDKAHNLGHRTMLAPESRCSLVALCGVALDCCRCRLALHSAAVKARYQMCITLYRGPERLWRETTVFLELSCF